MCAGNLIPAEQLNPQSETFIGSSQLQIKGLVLEAHIQVFLPLLGTFAGGKPVVENGLSAGLPKVVNRDILRKGDIDLHFITWVAKLIAKTSENMQNLEAWRDKIS